MVNEERDGNLVHGNLEIWGGRVYLSLTGLKFVSYQALTLALTFLFQTCYLSQTGSLSPGLCLH